VLEQERGITIMAKQTSLHYKGFTINIVDTPGTSSSSSLSSGSPSTWMGRR